MVKPNTLEHINASVEVSILEEIFTDQLMFKTIQLERNFSSSQKFTQSK